MLELLVALALLALIAGGLAGALGIGTQVFDRARSLGTQQEEVAARRQLRDAVMQALPPTRITPFPNRFVGAPDRMQFVTLKATPYAPEASALRIEVRWQAGALSMTVEAIDDRGDVQNTWVHRLSEDVAEVAFEYLDTSRDGALWTPSWSDRPDLPALVRITGTGGSPRWVEFTVAPRL